MIAINDTSLIEVRLDNKPVFFLGCVALTVAILTMAWGTVVDEFVGLKKPFTFTTTESNIATLAMELRIPSPDMAIVGSSLSRRLDSGFFEHMNVMNLSLSGGSVMTGLEILNRSATLPPIILVEVNILDRPVDEELMEMGIIASQSRPWAILGGATKPIRYLLNKPFFSYISHQIESGRWNTKRISLRTQLPASYDIRSKVSNGLASWDSRDRWDIANTNIMRMNELIDKLESKGARVYLVYMPYVSEYDAHAFAQRNRELASGNKRFECARCIDVRKLVDMEQLRWVDGAHLDERSALVVADALQRQLLPEQSLP